MEIQTLTPERGLSRWAPILPPVSPPTGRYVHRIGICIFSDGDSNTYARERAVEMGTNIAPCKPAHRALCAKSVPIRRIIGTAALQGGRPVVAPLPADHLAHRLDHGSVQAGSSPDWLDSYGLTCQERCMLAACRPGTTKSV